MDGAIVRWRVEADNNGGVCPIRPQVLRPAGGGAYSAIAEDSLLIPVGFLRGEFNTQLPVHAGDRIGLSIDCPTGFYVYHADQPSFQVSRFEPQLGADSRAPSSSVSQATAQFNADIEPDTDCDRLGDESRDPLLSGGCLPPKVATLTDTLIFKRTITFFLDCALAGGNCDGNRLTMRALRTGGGATSKKRRVLSWPGPAFRLTRGIRASLRPS
jgi:hypothetical protein